MTFLLSHPFLADLSAAGQKPPLHFHPYQTEYVQVVSGRLILEVEGHERTITAGDGQVAVMRWANHRLSHPAPIDGPDGDRTVFILSAENTAESFRLDTMFFENWYGYQHELKARHSGAMDIIQVMSVSEIRPQHQKSLARWVQKACGADSCRLPVNSDVRCGIIISFTSSLASFRADLLTGVRYCARSVDWSGPGLSAIL